MERIDLGALAGIIIPVVIQIAKMILGMKNPTEITPEEQAAIVLFEALIAYLEVAK
jgi:hypothetical protein